jgi:hypothetical protein
VAAGGPSPLLTPWDPLAPSAAAAIFAGWDGAWWIAGGYAIELAAGRRVRAHDDIDVLILRRDHVTVHALLAGWELWAADPPGSLRPWLAGEVLPAAVHDIWCRERPDGPWRLQLMIDESDGDEWVARRDPRIRCPVRSLGRTTAAGIPYLAPAVQLLYKARAPRPKDDVDLAAALPILSAGERRWLLDAPRTAYGDSSPWTPHIAG